MAIIKVVFGGSLASSLLSESLSFPSFKDISGFLFGSLSTTKTTIITDNNQQTILKNSFLISNYHISDHLLSADLPPSQKDKLIGVFRFRRNSENQPYVKEKVLYRAVRERFGLLNDGFVFGVFTQEVMHNGSTQCFVSTFWGFENEESVGLEIVGLGESGGKTFVSLAPDALVDGGDALAKRNVEFCEGLVTNSIANLKRLADELEESEIKLSILRRMKLNPIM